MEISDDTVIVSKPWRNLKEIAMVKNIKEQEWFKNLSL